MITLLIVLACCYLLPILWREDARDKRREQREKAVKAEQAAVAAALAATELARWRQANGGRWATYAESAAYYAAERKANAARRLPIYRDLTPDEVSRIVSNCLRRS